MPNFSPKEYSQQEIVFNPSYQLWQTAQKIQDNYLRWLLRSAVKTVSEMAEVVMLEHYSSILPFKPKNWMMCHQPSTLEEAMVLIEAHTLTEAGAYLFPRFCRYAAEKGWTDLGRKKIPGATLLGGEEEKPVLGWSKSQMSGVFLHPPC